MNVIFWGIDSRFVIVLLGRDLMHATPNLKLAERGVVERIAGEAVRAEAPTRQS